SSRSMPPIGSTPSNPASFMTRYFSSTEPFTPIVECMIALRKLRFEAAAADGRTAVAAALAAAILRNDRRFINKVWLLRFGCYAFKISSQPLRYTGRLMNGAASAAFVARRF